jgi:xanthine dehydrogenase FAD-binding subunit
MFDVASYHKANSITEAIALLGQYPSSNLIAGGTDILVRLHEGNQDYQHLVDIHNIAELKKIERLQDGTITIGSGATFSEIIDSPVIRETLPVLIEGAESIGGPQVRNAATIGGNICNGAPSADSAAPLLVLNAHAELIGPDTKRLVPVENFYLKPGQVDCKPGEILTCFQIIPADYQNQSAKYIKYAMRDAMDIATIGCAGSCLQENGKITELRLAYTVAGPTPLRCRTTEKAVLGMTVNEALIKKIKHLVLHDLMPRDSWRAGKDFREHIIIVLAERILKEILNIKGSV